MVEPGWISFYTAAAEIERRFGGTYGYAQHRLRAAAAEGHLRAMKAPFEETSWRSKHPPTISILPFEKWDHMLAAEWAEWRGADDVIVMINEDDFRHWLDREPELQIAKPRTIKQRKRKQDIAKQAIDALWPDGIPDAIVNKEVIQKVGNWLKANGASALSPDTILRAAGRKR
jgi:hypothetical protein